MNYTFIALLLAISHIAAAVDRQPVDWLDKMSRASQALNYEGYLVYQSGIQLESLKVIHRVDGDSIYEKVSTLSGALSEITRSNGVVDGRLNDESNLAKTQRFTSGFFPQIPVQQLVKPDSSYQISYAGEDRIAGYPSQVILVKPSDRFRYGLKLWIEKDSGLLLRSAVINHRRQIIEQAMFTNISIGLPQKPKSIIEQASVGSEASNDISQSVSQPGGKTDWFVEKLPKGFKLTAHTLETEQGIETRHFVYSDGIAFVSVYINEAMEEKDIPLKGLSRFGAMNVYGSYTKDRFVLVVGEVPAITVANMARSVTQAPK
ncbi:MAG: MucB/RseB C-terminal domain-containing protein [bacterium]